MTTLVNHLQGEAVAQGVVTGEALVTSERISFNLGVDENTGIVIERGHALEGQSIAGKVLVFAGGKGSTSSSFSLLQMVREGRGPVAMLNLESDAIVAAGAVLAGIPLVHRCVPDAIKTIVTGDKLCVDGTSGKVIILERHT